MKANSKILSVIGLIACSMVGLAQDNYTPAVGNDQQPALETTSSTSKDNYTFTDPEVLQREATIVAATPSETPEPLFAAAATETAVEETVEPTTETNETAEVVVEDTPMTEESSTTDEAPTEAEAATNSFYEPEMAEIIPIIVMDDVPLVDAIKNLARQAELNYIMDPKVPYGSIGPDGTPIPQPSISIRWENLTAGQALGALLNNYSLQIVDDPKTKIARITVKDPAAPDPLVTKVIQLNYTDPKAMAGHIQSTLTDKRAKVVADVRTSQIILLATEREVDSAEKLVAQLDTPTKQVLIEAHLVETSINPKSVKGIDWSDTLTAQRFTFGNGITSGTDARTTGATTASSSGTSVGSSGEPFVAPDPTAGGPGTSAGTTALQSLLTSVGAGGLSLNTASGFSPHTAFLNADGVSAALSFLNSDADSEVVSSPKAITLDNETADLSVTRGIPIFKTTAGTQGSPGGAEVTYTNIGTILKVTPRISADNYVFLKVVPEVSNVSGVDSKVVAGVINEANIYDIRKVETQVLIPSGNTLVMGGLVSDDRTKGYKKVPLLGDIPFLGLMFRHESKSRLKKNLMIFVTPTIVQDTDFQPTQTTFLNNKLKPLEDDKLSAWDSGKPWDWSNRESEEETTW